MDRAKMPADWRVGDDDVTAILAARHANPFGVLGPILRLLDLLVGGRADA